MSEPSPRKGSETSETINRDFGKVQPLSGASSWGRITNQQPVRVALFVLVLFAGSASWALAQNPLSGSRPEIHEVDFDTWPPGARVVIETSGGDRYLGLSGRPIPLDINSLAPNFWVKFELDGYRIKRERIPRGYFSDKQRYPDPGQPAMRLDAMNPLVDLRYLIILHPIPSAVLLLLIGTATALILRGHNRTLAVLRRGGRLESMLTQARGVDTWANRKLGNYMVLERLGTGGMATVYRAVPHASLDEKEAVAIKIMRPEAGADADFRTRFNREIRICSGLNHPGIVALIEWGEEEDALYLVMELVAGDTLRSSIPEKGMAVGKAMPLLTQIFDAVAYAHESSIVHRDLKPENIMVTAAGRIKVMDFGLARGQKYSTVTVAGTALGTPAYMAPEQIAGTVLDARSDQYALGILTYELLTGRVPFKDEIPINLLFKHMTEEPPPPRQFRADIPPAVEVVILRLLSKDPVGRFPTLKEALEALTTAALT